MSRRSRFRMSWWNGVAVALLLVGALVLLVIGRWPTAIVFAAVALIIGATAIYARTSHASDLTRLNAAEYVDERDRSLARAAFTAVGIVALATSLATLILSTVLVEPGNPMMFVALANVLVLLFTWIVANIVVLRRS